MTSLLVLPALAAYTTLAGTTQPPPRALPPFPPLLSFPCSVPRATPRLPLAPTTTFANHTFFLPSHLGPHRQSLISLNHSHLALGPSAIPFPFPSFPFPSFPFPFPYPPLPPTVSPTHPRRSLNPTPNTKRPFSRSGHHLHFKPRPPQFLES
ncbi:hypothetical protein IE53DRAFT_172212 [Violaceomyces palustris]|uniref:Uncharacterized protein n=1 Tax=Violaceomyces palustris TaxID=1673888 RepID=A0ACD0NSY4_9BASI|nr:hypothetical protein IE53DRAFT_172212 [Violaceomyces palustris]